MPIAPPARAQASMFNPSKTRFKNWPARRRVVVWSIRLVVAAIFIVGSLWAIERLLWGPTGAAGIATAGRYTPGKNMRVWASGMSPEEANDIPEPWDWLPFCWPPLYDDARPRATSLYDVVTGRTSGATVYNLPIMDVGDKPAVDPDLYPRPPADSVMRVATWADQTACRMDFSMYTRAQRDLTVSRWDTIAKGGYIMDADVDGGLPVLWLREAYEDGRPALFRSGIPFGTGEGRVYTHHSFVVWLEPGGADSATVVRVTVVPSRLIAWPPKQASRAALAQGGNATVIEWTWDVALVHSSLASSRRLDVFFRMGGASVQGPFLIAGVAITCVVSLLFTVYLVRVLGRRVATSVYPVGGERLSKILSSTETTGREWVKSGLAGEYFRQPHHSSRLLAALVGTGLQIRVLIITIFLLGGAGILWVRMSTYGSEGGASPIDRLASLSIVLLLLTHVIGGAWSVRIHFRWVYHERTIHMPDAVPIMRRGAAAAADDGTEEDEEAGEGATRVRLHASWKDVRGTPEYVVERILQDWAHIYLDWRTSLMTAALLPIGSAPIYVPLILLAGGNPATLAASVAVWLLMAVVLVAVGGHAAVAWTTIPDDSPRRVLAQHSKCEHVGWGLGIFAPLVFGLASFMGGGMLACLAFMLALHAGGYVSVFPFLALAFVLWIYQSNVAAVLVAWKRLQKRNWHWHWAAWWNGAAVAPILVFVIGLGGQLIVGSTTTRATAVVWLTAVLASVWLAMAHASATYLRVSDFVVMAFGQVADALSQD